MQEEKAIFSFLLFQVNFMPPLKKRKDSTSEKKAEAISCSRIVGQVMEYPALIVDHIDLTEDDTGALNSFGMGSMPLENRIKSLDSLYHKDFVPNAGSEHKDYVRDSPDYPSPELTDFEIISKHCRPESWHSKERGFVSSLTSGEDNSGVRNEKGDFADVSLREDKEQNKKLARFPDASRAVNVNNRTNYISVCDSANFISGNSDETDESEKVTRSKTCNTPSFGGNVCSEMMPPRNAQELEKASKHLQSEDTIKQNSVSLNMHDIERRKYEGFSHSEEKCSDLFAFSESSNPNCVDRLSIKQGISGVISNHKDHAGDVSKTSFNRWKSTKEFDSNFEKLRQNDYVEIAPGEPMESRVNPGSEMPCSSNSNPIERSGARPKDEIKLVAAIVVKALSKYNQSNRIANKVS